MVRVQAGKKKEKACGGKEQQLVIIRTTEIASPTLGSWGRVSMQNYKRTTKYGLQL